MDVESVFDLVLQDPTFKGLMQDLNHTTAAQVIPEAINVLHSGQRGYLVVSSEAYLIIALIQQWLVRYLCKQLMQLMTPEALILHRNKMPSSYLENYINFQTHFSMQNLIIEYLDALESTTG